MPSMSLFLTTVPFICYLLHTFWEIKEPFLPAMGFTDDQKCEENFRQTTTWNFQGLLNSRTMAISRFYNLERKL